MDSGHPVAVGCRERATGSLPADFRISSILCVKKVERFCGFCTCDTWLHAVRTNLGPRPSPSGLGLRATLRDRISLSPSHALCAFAAHVSQSQERPNG